MKNPFSRLSLLWKILLSTSVAITLLFAVTGWIVLNDAIRVTSESVRHEVNASFQAYQSLWQSRVNRLSSISAILSAMSDVRAAFGTQNQATIRDTAGELWSRVSDENAVFLVTDPRGQVIASLGGASRPEVPAELDVVREAAKRFPSQVSGFLSRENRLYHLTITPVYVQSTGGQALLDVLVVGYDINAQVAGRLKQATGGSEFVFASGNRTIASTLSPANTAALAAQLETLGQTEVTPNSVPAMIRVGRSEYAPLVTPLADISGAPVGRLAVLRSFDAARRQISELRRNIVLLWLFSMLAGLALTYVLARRIVEPVKALDRAAAEVGRQNYDCQVTVESRDELGRLAATFNAMCASIRRARDELIQTERIATIGRLAASIVHDLRNPLAAIYGGAEILLEGQLSGAQQHRLARNIYRSSRQIQEMLQDLLNLSRGKTEDAERCDLKTVAAAAVESLSPAAQSQSVSIVLEVPEGIQLACERRRIERVFLTLISNAIEAMPEGGTITLSAANEPGAVVVRVRDTGPGISPEIAGRLFQPFVTGKKGGLGLGLVLARQAVKDHGGEIWMEPPDGARGACFCFRLPQDLPPSARTRAS